MLPLRLPSSAAVVCCRQPIYRRRLIEVAFGASLLALVLAPLPLMPRMHLGLVGSSTLSATAPVPASNSPILETPLRILTDAPQGNDAKPAPSATSAPANRDQRDSSFAANLPHITGRSLAGGVVAAYLTGLALFVAVWATGIIRLWVIACRARAVPAWVHSQFLELAGPAGRRVRLLASDQVDTPLAYRGRRRVIILPVGLCEASRAKELGYGLAHEWHHICHRDVESWYTANLVLTLFYFQPLAWWLRRRLRLAQDVLADAQAASAAPAAADYAQFLVNLARRRASRAALPAIALLDGRTHLETRVTQLLHPRRPLAQRCAAPWRVAVTAAALLAAVTLAAVRLDGKPPAAAANSQEAASVGQADRDEAGDEEPEAVDLTFIVAEHAMLLEGKEIVTWEELEQRIAALPNPSRVIPHVYLTNGAHRRGSFKPARDEMNRLYKKYKLKAMSLGSLTPRSGHRYDGIREPADLILDETLRVEGRVVDGDGNPVVGAEVILIPPLDESISYREYGVALVDGRVRNRLEHVITDSSPAGSFAIYPPADVQYDIMAIHPDVGFALVPSDFFQESFEIRLHPWSRLVIQLHQEPGEQPTISLTSAREKPDSQDKIVVNQYSADRDDNPENGKFEFRHIPPLLETSIRRNYLTDAESGRGGTIGLHEMTVSLMFGETRQIHLTPPSGAQRAQLKDLRRRAQLDILFRQRQNEARRKAQADSQDKAASGDKASPAESKAEETARLRAELRRLRADVGAPTSLS